MKNFWSSFAKASEDKQKLKNPLRRGSGQVIYALAPMAGFTDSAFRQICKDFGADVVYSEMASATALVYNPKKTLEMLWFAKKERPYVVQLFGSRPEHFAHATKLVTEKLKPDGIDLNFGCPVKKILKQGAGAALLDNTKLSREIIMAVAENTDLPISLKIRSKGRNIGCLKFLDGIKDLPISAIMIHGRTYTQGFSGEIDWQTIKKARKYFSGIILANGGIKNAFDAIELLRQTEADGVGIARGAVGQPWIFQKLKAPLIKGGGGILKPKSFKEFNEKNLEEIFDIILKHALLAEKIKGERGIIEMRAHLCAYIAGFSRAKNLREKLVKVKKVGEIEELLKSSV